MKSQIYFDKMIVSNIRSAACEQIWWRGRQSRLFLSFGGVFVFVVVPPPFACARSTQLPSCLLG